MGKVKEEKFVKNELKRSDFYWGVYMIMASVFIVGYYIIKDIVLSFGGIAFFILSWIISHSNKAEKSLDYKKVKDAR
jgi:hypothetical protein